MSFLDKAINYLQDRGILVGKIEQSSPTSVVLHVAPADRVKVVGDFKEAMEADLNAYVEQSDMGGFSVVIVEAKEEDDEEEDDEEEEEETKSEEDEESETTNDESDDEEDSSDAEDSETETPSNDEADITTAKYKMLASVTRTDVSGTPQTYPEGAVIELPCVYGKTLVEQGQAELVVE